jgi:hypothetical protein
MDEIEPKPDLTTKPPAIAVGSEARATTLETSIPRWLKQQKKTAKP